MEGMGVHVIAGVLAAVLPDLPRRIRDKLLWKRIPEEESPDARSKSAAQLDRSAENMDVREMGSSPERESSSARVRETSNGIPEESVQADK